MEMINKADFKRKPDPFIDQHQSVLHTRALIMGQYGMLQCANNFSCGFGTKTCTVCKVIDDEEHRINDCVKYQDVNLFHSTDKIKYGDIYSNDTAECFAVVERIISMWDLENGRNKMRHEL